MADGPSNYECIDPKVDLDNCGGCAITGQGEPCSAIEGVKGTAFFETSLSPTLSKRALIFEPPPPRFLPQGIRLNRLLDLQQTREETSSKCVYQTLAEDTGPKPSTLNSPVIALSTNWLYSSIASTSPGALHFVAQVFRCRLLRLVPGGDFLLLLPTPMMVGLVQLYTYGHRIPINKSTTPKVSDATLEIDPRTSL
ncbi:hypothetical protein FRB99_005117 [Tulasnella sp. 403]|nr:hypothetical protein FRB99_005117 [Tulasnella sp. 403]